MVWKVLKEAEFENFGMEVTIASGRRNMTGIVVQTNYGSYVHEISFYYQGEKGPYEFFERCLYQGNKPVAFRCGSDDLFSQSPWSDHMRRSIDDEVMTHFEELMRSRPDLEPVVSSAIQQIRR